MRKTYNLVLTVMTIVMLIFISFVKLNDATNWVNFGEMQWFVDAICAYGPMVMLCLFAFQSIIFSKLLFIIIIILLIVATICMFAPDWLASIFNGSKAAFNLFLRL